MTKEVYFKAYRPQLCTPKFICSFCASNSQC